MRTLNNYIQEKLVVFPSQVDEKLVINKSYKQVHNYKPDCFPELIKIIIDKLSEPDIQKNQVLDMSDVNVSSMKDMSDIFNADTYQFKKTYNGDSCMDLLKNIKTLNISGWDTSNVKSFYALFNGCTNLENIIGIEDLDVSNAHTISHMFNGCENLTKLDLSKWNVGNVKMMTSLFYRCVLLEEIKGIEKWQFSTVGNLSFNGMFNECESLRSINISNWKVENVRDCDSMFRRCYELTSIGDISGWKLEHIDSIEKMFFGCSKLRNIGNIDVWSDDDYDRFNRSLYCVNAFRYCDKSIIPEWYKRNQKFNT